MSVKRAIFKVVKIFLVIAVVAIAALVGVASRQPDDFRVSRSAVFNAPPEKIFPFVNSHRAWNEWSPWAKLDPNAKFTLEGPDFGVGAVSTWEGNWEAGAGRSTIVESREAELIKFKLEFLKPMQATNFAEFAFKPVSDGTEVTWSMYGTNNLLGKVMGLIIDCEKMVGTQFETGLSNLKSSVESQAS